MIPIIVMILHKKHFLFYFLYLTVGSPLHPHCCCVDSQCLLNLWQIYSFSTTIEGGRGEEREEEGEGERGVRGMNNWYNVATCFILTG